MPVCSRRWLTLLMTLALLLSGFGADGAVAAPPGKGSQGGATCPVAGGAQVVLDPGHGGDDPGAVNSTYGLEEEDLTLEIAYRTQALLQHAGYSVALTRYGDTGLGNSERGEIANACGALVFVEIHLNGSSDPSVNYSQTFWGKKRKDLEFSQVMSGALSSLGIPNNGTGQFANGGLLQATMPSTLVEAVFLTNNDEGAKFAAGTRQGEIAQAIAAGVMAFL
ncbi:MAG: N-acetylmuramoyl-L-alanine amidase [uncultured Thermomicrobiales bacterium]|uniref:N-acetylmuramoyl-L-alanine amidase n=1 Tax=uncultured Thermomicrobiales bacterium TaxID=1645740 RepID=A0A6J4VJ91_9BACT|nr:MAG: N-acetylmuramoyl-L-alanine amidase [uncultured Thermomicrobiales bacterium]